MGLEGALCLVVDRIMKTRYIMLYSLENLTLLFYTEMYVNFKKNFVKLNSRFFSFPADKIVVGL